MRLKATIVAATIGLAALAGEPGLPAASWVEPGVTEETMKSEIDASGRHPIEGLWQATADGATVAIVRRRADVAGLRTDAETYLMVLVESPMHHLAAGTVMGVAQATSKAGHYDARLYTRMEGTGLAAPKPFTLRLADDNRLAFVPVTRSLKFNLWKLLPYMFRNTVSRTDTRAADLDGCVRLYPPTGTAPIAPRYL